MKKLSAAEYKRYRIATEEDVKGAITVYQFFADGTIGGGLYPVVTVDPTRKAYVLNEQNDPYGIGYDEPPYPDQDPAAKLCKYCRKTLDNCICD